MSFTDFPCGRIAKPLSRREWLLRAGSGAGMVAMASMLAEQRSLGATQETYSSLKPRHSHFPPKAKSVIWLFMEGAPSAVDMFDPKPALTKRHGQTTDIKAFFGNPGPLMKSPFKFKQYGECGQWVCDRYTHVAQHVDKMALIKSCYSESNDHVPAIYQINSGLPRPGFPTAGAWVTYGLGSENQNLPGYVVMGNTKGAKGGPHNWGSGFLPSTFAGTLFRSQGAPILNLKRQPQITAGDQRAQLDLMAKLNDEHMKRHPGDAEFADRMQSFELAYRMQSEATEVVDLSRESPATHKLYGIDNPASRSYGSKCLMARRLIESGVRFVQVYSDGEWDAHNNLEKNHTEHCLATDVPVAGLLTDLDRRGLLEGNPCHLGWRVRAHADFAERQRPRPQPKWIHAVHGRGGNQRRCQLWRARRNRICRRRKSSQCQRPTRDDLALTRSGSRAVNILPQR